MKRFVVAVSVVALVFAVTIQAQTPAPQPGPEQKKMEVFAGQWTYEGEYKSGSFGPGGKATGEYTAEMILGGFFIRGRYVERMASKVSRGFETFGYNPATRNYLQSQYADDGSMGSGAMTVNGNTWNYSGTMSSGGKQAKFRNTMTFAADGMSMVMKAELSADGTTWMPFWDFKFTKLKATAKKPLTGDKTKKKR